jgi:shikimate kinase
MRTAKTSLIAAGTRSISTRSRSCVFLCGLPGSGKSSVIAARWGVHSGQPRSGKSLLLDLDIVMKAHPRYLASDPKAIYADPKAYAWADEQVEAQYQAALLDETLGTIICDGTGAKLERRLQRMHDARRSGCRIKMLLVRVSIATAERRNAQRKRQVTFCLTRHRCVALCGIITTTTRAHVRRCHARS